MNLSKTRRLAALAGVIAGVAIVQGAVLLTGASPASAVPGLNYQMGPVTPTDSAPAKTATALCPTGQVVVGGGAMADDFGAGQVMLTKLKPVDGGSGRDRFEVAAEKPREFTGDWYLQAYALCASPLAGYEIRPNTTTPASPTFLATAAGCTPGKRVIGTGAEVGNTAGSGQVGLQMTRASGPLDISRATAREDASGFLGNWTLTSYAICANPVGAAVQSGFDSDTGAFTVCPSGRLVHGVGGGGGLTDGGPVFLQTLLPFSDLDRISVHMSGVPTGGVLAQAVCAP